MIIETFSSPKATSLSFFSFPEKNNEESKLKLSPLCDTIYVFCSFESRLIPVPIISGESFGKEIFLDL
jgi:hypothetical protein